MMFDEIVHKSGEIFCSLVFKVSPKIAHTIEWITGESIAYAILLGDDSIAVVDNYFWGLFLLIIGIPIIWAIISGFFQGAVEARTEARKDEANVESSEEKATEEEEANEEEEVKAKVVKKETVKKEEEEKIVDKKYSIDGITFKSKSDFDDYIARRS